MRCFWNQIVSVINTHKIHLLIFAVTLFLILGCTLPKIFLNDEWITTNQLTQIDQGHQVIINEGKYGSFENGTPYNYFIKRSNALGYSLFLPLISLPALKCINFFGDSFLFFLIEFWTILLIGISLFITRFFPEYSDIQGYKWTNIAIIGTFLLFFCNLLSYQPFLFVGKNTYPEIAAIALTNVFFLAVLAVILYATFFTIFKLCRISISAMIISICCSSYIFWTTTAKDHMLVALLIGVLIYCGVKYIYTNNRWYLPAFFIVVGWIAWVRAEIAVPLFGLFLILVIVKSIRVILTEKKVMAGFFFLLVPVFTIIGAIPLFINNYFITGNPLISPFIIYNQKISGVAGAGIVNSLVKVLPAVPVNISITQNGGYQFFDIIITMYSIEQGTSIFELLRILFLPGTVNIAVFVVCPVLIVGFALALLAKIRWNNFSHPEKSVLFFLIVISISIFIAYVHSWSSMIYDRGIIPDVRYLSPIYLAFSIIGVLLLQKCRIFPTFSKKGWFVLLFTLGEIILVLITFLIYFQPSDHDYNIYISIVSKTITCIMFALVCVCILAFVFIRNEQKKMDYCSLLLHAIIIVPLSWQLAVIFSSSINTTYEGYTYWIPVVKYAMQHLQTFIIR